MLALTSSLLGIANKPLFAFGNCCFLFLMQIYHNFHFVVTQFGFGVITGTNGSDDLHVKLEICLRKTAMQRVAPLHAQYRIPLIIKYSVNLFVLFSPPTENAEVHF